MPSIFEFYIQFNEGRKNLVGNSSEQNENIDFTMNNDARKIVVQ